MTALLIFVVLALLASFSFFLGGGPALLVLAFVALVVAAGWFVATSVTGRRPSHAIRRTRSQELLGPGGPDDPERDVT